MYSKAAIASLLLPVAFAAVHEQLNAVPSGWSHASSQPSNNDVITLQVGLNYKNSDKLEDLIYSVSTPGSKNYGKYYSKAQVDALIKPSSDDCNAVEAWLKHSGVTNFENDGYHVTFSTTVEKANGLLSTTFQNYKDKDGVVKLRTTEYSVPDDLANIIDLITPTTFFGKTHAQAAIPHEARMPTVVKRQFDGNCSSVFTHQCAKEAYNIQNYTADAKSGSRVAFSSFLNQSAQYSDLAAFEKFFNIPSQNFTVELINNGVNWQNATNDNINNFAEANLDSQYVLIAHPLPVTEFITGGSPPFIGNLDEPQNGTNSNEPYLEYYQYLLAKENADLPQVISNSYGDDEQTVPYKYAKRVCDLIGVAGLRGISVLESSGDTGVGAPCMTNDGTNKPVFTAEFPGTCPYVTAVGGTQGWAPEVAWVDSSGGFSNYFPQPRYQVQDVQNYLNNELPAETRAYFAPFFNATGRGFPDVAAHSVDYRLFLANTPYRIGGTSAACPTFAGLIALVNDALLRDGKPQLGFLNPFLYGMGRQGLTDVTLGGSVGCTGVNGQTGANITGGGVIPYASWNATVGWDPVTGLGLPNFQKLVGLAKQALGGSSYGGN